MLLPLARATVVFDLGNHPQNDEHNILLNTGTTGNTVLGSIVGVDGILVDFSSDQIELEPSMGQARVSGDPDHVPLDELTIALNNNATYGDLIINPFIGNDCPLCVKGGFATITVNSMLNGIPEAAAIFNYNLNGADQGNNFLTIVASDGERITSTRIDYTPGFDDLRQPRISGVQAAVPEPGFYGILGVGLACLFWLKRLKTND